MVSHSGGSSALLLSSQKLGVRRRSIYYSFALSLCVLGILLWSAVPRIPGPHNELESPSATTAAERGRDKNDSPPVSGSELPKGPASTSLTKKGPRKEVPPDDRSREDKESKEKKSKDDKKDEMSDEVKAALKAGTWKEVKDPSIGKTFYYNPTTKKTTWDLKQELKEAKGAKIYLFIILGSVCCVSIVFGSVTGHYDGKKERAEARLKREKEKLLLTQINDLSTTVQLERTKNRVLQEDMAIPEVAVYYYDGGGIDSKCDYNYDYNRC